MSSRRAGLVACSLVALGAVWCALAAPKTPPPSPPPESPGWVRVEYGTLVDGRRPTHSGEPVGVLLQRLSGRPMPASGERREDAQAYRLLDPILEPYAFVLSDALDASSPRADLPWVEVGSLWESGETQPAWVELVRARHFVLESDGDGHLRACLPAPSLAALPVALPEGKDPVATAKEAWDRAWPVLRHALAGERRRLQRLRGGELPELDVEVHAYRHLLAVSAFDLGARAWRTKVADTGPREGRATFDLAGLSAIFEHGRSIEGARLEPSGKVRWFTSDVETKPTILGRPPTLADAAVAYRAIAHGGVGEPYMSLDRAAVPHRANVNYGGRLRDTALGLVSLLSDVRFKTLSVGIDLLGDGDVRESVRRALPEFRTHLERFASDPTAGAILNQQTRFWFYPDDVDLTLSEQGDVLAFRKVRMTAASERVKDASAPGADPPWTKDTVAFVNAHYDQLAALFPELADLDESVRLLALFTWLDAAKNRGLAVPDLDVLLALELPALPTPRRFPELLSHDVLSAPGAGGIVDVLDRTSVGDALDRLEPETADALPAGRRFARDQALLNPQIPDQAAVARDMAALAADAGDVDRDVLSYRAERLLMHARVLATIPAGRRTLIDDRRKREPSTRVFSVGIGGVDLGMNVALARAARRGGRLGLSANEPQAAAKDAAPSSAGIAPGTEASDPPGLVAIEWPDHGLGPVAERAVVTLPGSTGTIVSRRRPGSVVRQGSFKAEGAEPVPWVEVVSAMDGPEARSRRRITDPAGGAASFERLEDGRFLAYQFVRAGDTLRATPSVPTLPGEAYAVARAAAVAGAVPGDLLLMDLPEAQGGSVADGRGEAPAISVRLRAPGGSERVASVPRSLLQRLVRGREIDLTPERPLQAFTPAAEILGSSRELMVLELPDQTRAPWAGPIAVRPGEEDPARLAAALTRWWSADPAPTARAVVGVDAVDSPVRWAQAPLLDGTLSLVAPESGFPAETNAVRAELAGLPGATTGGRVLLVVSDEAPGVLGRRLRALASDPGSSGKVLAVVSLGGTVRADLPASLLGESKIAALGLYQPGGVGVRKSLAAVAAWAKDAVSEGYKGKRVEDPPGPFNWFY